MGKIFRIFLLLSLGFLSFTYSTEKYQETERMGETMAQTASYQGETNSAAPANTAAAFTAVADDSAGTTTEGELHVVIPADKLGSWVSIALLVLLLVYTLLARLIPTSRSYDIVGAIIRIVSQIIPDRIRYVRKDSPLDEETRVAGRRESLLRGLWRAIKRTKS